jgi:hypothetical protein
MSIFIASEAFAECPEGSIEVIRSLPNGRVLVQCIPDKAASHFQNIPGTYVIEQISENPSGAGDLKMNDSGYIVWRARVGNYNEIFLYDGSKVEQISTNSNGVWDPQINNNNFVTWEQTCGVEPSEIWLYDGSTTEQITKNEIWDRHPYMTSTGNVIWLALDGKGVNLYSYVVSTGKTLEESLVIGYNYALGPGPILSDEYLSWIGRPLSGPLDWVLFLYDGMQTIGFLFYYRSDDPSDFWFEMNSSGNLVWHEADEGATPYEDYEIYFYDGSNKIRLTDNSYTDTYPYINENSHIVWTANVDWLDEEIFLYDGSNTIQLTDNSYRDLYPVINSNNDVAWIGGGTVFLASRGN